VMDFNGGPVSPESKSGAIPARCGQSSGKTGLWRSPAARRSVCGVSQGRRCSGGGVDAAAHEFCTAELGAARHARVWGG